jgi:NADH:ubiquinone oxidoreductase subunit 3 (subunit A)
MSLPFLFRVFSWDEEKVSLYECGFSPFFEFPVQFDVKFYLTALLFIIFDVEIILLLP